MTRSLTFGQVLGLIPISSGLTPQSPGAGRLNPERAAELRRALRQLEAARTSASIAARSYPIGRTTLPWEAP